MSDKPQSEQLPAQPSAAQMRTMARHLASLADWFNSQSVMDVIGINTGSRIAVDLASVSVRMMNVASHLKKQEPTS